MDEWRGYFAIERFTANLGQANWDALVALVDQIAGKGEQPHQKNHWRTRLDGDAKIYEAQFYAGNVSFATFKNRLVNVFQVDPELVTYTVATTTIKNRLSCFATYKYNSVNRFRLGLFGCESDELLCTWSESRIEVIQYLKDHLGEWE